MTGPQSVQNARRTWRGSAQPAGALMTDQTGCRVMSTPRRPECAGPVAGMIWRAIEAALCFPPVLLLLPLTVSVHTLRLEAAMLGVPYEGPMPTFAPPGRDGRSGASAGEERVFGPVGGVQGIAVERERVDGALHRWQQPLSPGAEHRRMLVPSPFCCVLSVPSNTSDVYRAPGDNLPC